MKQTTIEHSVQTILVVDDEQFITDLLREYFMELGYEVYVAKSAEDALDILKNSIDFNLIISDINLPGRSGIDLLKIVKETKEELPVVLLTGLKTLDNAISAVKGGAADYITKPFELDSVRKVVEKILKRQKRSIKKEQVFENLRYAKMNFQFKTVELDCSLLAKELASMLQKVHFSPDEEIKQFELAFSETLVNAIEHGNLELSSSYKSNDILKINEYEDVKEKRLADPAFANRKINIIFECTEELFSFTVQDEGKGFNWRRYINKSHQISEVNTNAYGRGFNLIQHIIDEVHFNPSGNAITLIKNR